ncbi:response regulator transcription factor [Clostridium aestuarii]|uniref:Stage 0 sporulation protein A homolog n=1 Tax=Clostridium aestuarii TaxID=338193 RepID=A0ABT4D164_9CLOT|nr:response regulator transcription factor [Clostridium aestuarii]MCY6484979.1 response regulator transcription factor [Clostridium aestuarii]
MKGKILIIEDERQLSEVMALYLTKEGYELDFAYDGEEGEDKIESDFYDLVILDVMMPKKDGWSLLRSIKANHADISVILTTARGEEDDRIFGLELGADDYMVKPLSMRELVLRVNLRLNSKVTKNENKVIMDNLIIEEENRTITEDNKVINLTPKEFDLFIFLLKNANQVFKRDQLLDKVWGYDFIGDTRTVDTHVKKLREKIKFSSKNLKTVWGVGYKLELKSKKTGR